MFKFIDHNYNVTNILNKLYIQVGFSDFWFGNLNLFTKLDLNGHKFIFDPNSIKTSLIQS